MVKSFLIRANKRYDTVKDVKMYQKSLTREEQEQEQQWVDENLMILIDYMGREDVWKLFVDGVDVKGSGGRASTKSVKDSKRPYAVFSGAHWRSKKEGEDQWFDPYDHYQVNGTNQFCQTFSMMHLLGKLPLPEKDGWKRYYVYTKKALEFINECLDVLEDDEDVLEARRALKSCLKYPNACLNVIEFP